jgi:hypothetical protein
VGVLRLEEFEYQERMYTTGLPGRLAHFRMEVVVTPIMMGKSIAG